MQSAAIQNIFNHKKGMEILRKKIAEDEQRSKPALQKLPPRLAKSRGILQ